MDYFRRVENLLQLLRSLCYDYKRSYVVRMQNRMDLSHSAMSLRKQSECGALIEIEETFWLSIFCIKTLHVMFVWVDVFSKIVYCRKNMEFDFFLSNKNVNRFGKNFYVTVLLLKLATPYVSTTQEIYRRKKNNFEMISLLKYLSLFWKCVLKT